MFGSTLLPRFRGVLACAVFGFSLAACSSGGGGTSDNPAIVVDEPKPTKSIVDIVREDPRLTTLGKALDAAGLTDTLQSGGPYTLFAPTNEAFAALLLEEGPTEEQLLADKSLLARLLRYHVLPQAASIRECECFEAPVPTLEGGLIDVNAYGLGDWRVVDELERQSRVVTPDLKASNGFVHVIAQVALPNFDQ